MANRTKSSDENTAERIDENTEADANTELAIAIPVARDIATMEDLLAAGMELDTASDVLGDGTEMLENKDLLINQPLVFLSWRFNESKQYNDETGKPLRFVSAVVLQMGTSGEVVDRFIVNDGSTGMAKMLTDHSERTGKYGGLYAPRGLTKSEYPTEDKEGNKITGVTYYINTAKRR